MERGWNNVAPADFESLEFEGENFLDAQDARTFGYACRGYVPMLLREVLHARSMLLVIGLG